LRYLNGYAIVELGLHTEYQWIAGNELGSLFGNLAPENRGEGVIKLDCGCLRLAHQRFFIEKGKWVCPFCAKGTLNPLYYFDPDL